VPHVLRKCKACGREMKISEAGEHGIGIRVREGDQFIIPKDWLKISANPLKGGGHLTRDGLEWFAKLIFLEEIPQNHEAITTQIKKNDDLCMGILKKSELLKGLDIENPEHGEKILEILKGHQESAEWWVFAFGFFNELARKAIEQGDAQKAAWAMACAERYRSMLVFKQHLEEVIWMGHSAKRLVNMLQVWDGNKDNSDEGYWQIKFKESSYVLSQVFSVPVVFIQDNAYIGGMSIDRKDAKFVDYLYSGDTSNEAILIEIKAPTTKLLGSKYRGVYKPSGEITGALIQVSDYKVSLMQNLIGITKGFGKELTAFNPRCLIIAGNGEKELDRENKRRSFELFRSNFQGIEIVTYDELFKKMEILATLFNLVKKKA
jgi:hypothetical protein